MQKVLLKELIVHSLSADHTSAYRQGTPLAIVLFLEGSEVNYPVI